MKSTNYFIAVFFFCFGLAPLYAAEKQCGWVVEGESLILRSEAGSIRKTIPLGIWPSQLISNEFPRREVAAVISKDGRYAFVRERNADVIGHISSVTVVGSFFDSEARLIWSGRSVRQGWVAPDGKILLLILSFPDGCNQEDGPDDCITTLLSIDQNGRPLVKLGPYEDVHLIGLSENVRYAAAKVWVKNLRLPKNIFFDARDHRFSFEIEELPGAPTIHDDGTVEFYQTRMDPGGGPARSIKADLIKKIGIPQ